MNMKTRFINIRRAASKAFVCSLTLLALLAFVLPQAAQASTAAYTTIRNTATVNYNDTAGTAMPAVSDSVDVTVEFVCVAPLLSSPGDGTTDPATNEVYTYTLTSQSNGPDTYAISAAVTAESAGISGSTATPSTASITLGATTVAGAAAIGATSITVPNDAGSNSSVNGIENGDLIVIGSYVYKVSTVTDNGGTVGGTSTINLDTTAPYTALQAAINPGDPIYEQQTFTVAVDPGALTAASNQTITVVTTADGSCDADTDETVTTVTPANLTIEKTASTASAAPGDTITYTIVVTNTGSSDANVVTITDPLPPYTTYVHQSTRLNGKTVANDGVADPSPLIAGLLVDDDDPARAAGAVSSGILSPAGVATITFQVTVN